MQRAPIPASGHSALLVADKAGSRWPLGGSKPAGDSLGGPLSPQWTSRDPRTSSTQSLVSSTKDSTGGDGRRKLLVVYIHGFMGNNSSFRSFPAHVHSFLRSILSETHTIHTKIYPRYKTYKSIDVACENFSRWLAPHESPTTDVVLVGHSMGGLLAADAVLLPSQGPYYASSPYRHRILGTISLDAPLLGLHPGIVVSGIASLFRPAPSPPAVSDATRTEYLQPARPGNLSPDPSIYSEVSPPLGVPSPSVQPYPSASTAASAAPDGPDPYFDPPFPNDVAFVDRGWFKNIMHFATKHKEENLVYAAASHIVSHLEFGACLADYSELRSRYDRLRRLEDAADWSRPGTVRVRFVNYFTVSTGIIKKPRTPSPAEASRRLDANGQSARPSLEVDAPASALRPSTEESRVPTPRISIEEYSDGPRPESFQSLQIMDPIPEPEPEPGPQHEQEAESPVPPSSQPAEVDPDTKQAPAEETPPDEATNQDADLPSIPDLPSPPPPLPDLDTYPDKESRKQAQKTFKLAQKTYEQAIKARDKAIKDRDKVLKERQKALEKQQRKALKLEKKQQAKLHKSPPPPPPYDDDDYHTINNPSVDRDQQQATEKRDKKPPRRRKFCMLPPKSNSTGQPDPAWVEVYMEGVDEVGAHCGLFMPGPHYERLVGDVGERIASWVWEDASRRVILEGGGGNADGHGGWDA